MLYVLSIACSSSSDRKFSARAKLQPPLYYSPTIVALHIALKLSASGILLVSLENY